MIFDHLPLRKGKKNAPRGQEKLGQSPVLTEDDEQFLKNLTSEALPLPPSDGSTLIYDDGSQTSTKDEQIDLLDGADQIPLPNTPHEIGTAEGDEINGEGDHKRWQRIVAHLPALPARILHKNKEKKEVEPEEVDKDKDDLTKVLDQLNLAAVDNRVFSFSADSQKLLEEFKLVLKDIVNGVPTAYDDLVQLLTNSESQLQKIFADLPPWLQTLVKSLPTKMKSFMGPEALATTAAAAAAEKPDVGMQSSASGTKGKKGQLPSLKKMISQRGSIAATLQTILQFLKFRFPSFMLGTNVLLSLSIFLLLLVFWYLHKRGRETRLAREAGLKEGEENSDIEPSDDDDDDDGNDKSQKREDTTK